MVPLALQLIDGGTLTLDAYAPTCERRPHGCSALGGHLRSEFPVGPALVAAVPLAAFELLVHLTRPVLGRIAWLDHQFERWESHAHATGDIDLGFFDVTENLIASLCCALAAMFFFLAASARLPQARALMITAVFAFATPVWSTASRVLWQSGPALMFASLALWLLTRERGLFGVGLSLAAAWVCRPPMVLLALVVVVFAAATRRRALPGLLLGLGVVVVAFLTANRLSLGTWLPPYFLSSRLEARGQSVPIAALGQLISPGRGLLIFTPVLLLVPWGLVTSWRQRSAYALLDAGFALWLLAHWLVISTFPHWWGGHSFGPRLWTESMLGACWLLAPLLAGPKVPRLLVVLAVVSALVHGRGSTSKQPWKWNDTPVNVDEAPERLWDWTDLQFLR
jgi:hypothetical protein